ncbi:MAG: Asp-tRNA(Asn)/Glu-tRNA(Gln) amidotransferase subunit GatC [Pseudomonadota bacterium]
MKISTEQVTNMARLARLYLEPEQLEPLATQFGEIINYMDVLNGVDTEGIEPLYSPFQSATPVRQDAVNSHCTREDLLANAPQTDGDFFVVPRIV